jgi:hypothetical protein
MVETHRLYTPQQGDNAWNVMEGNGPDTHPSGGQSDIVTKMPLTERRAALDRLFDYMEKNPEWTKTAAGIQSGDPNLITAHDTIDVTAMDDKLREWGYAPSAAAPAEVTPFSAPLTEHPAPLDPAPIPPPLHDADVPTGPETPPSIPAPESDAPGAPPAEPPIRNVTPPDMTQPPPPHHEGAPPMIAEAEAANSSSEAALAATPLAVASVEGARRMADGRRRLETPNASAGAATGEPARETAPEGSSSEDIETLVEGIERGKPAGFWSRLFGTADSVPSFAGTYEKIKGMELGTIVDSEAMDANAFRETFPGVEQTAVAHWAEEIQERINRNNEGEDGDQTLEAFMRKETRRSVPQTAAPGA